MGHRLGPFVYLQFLLDCPLWLASFAFTSSYPNFGRAIFCPKTFFSNYLAGQIKVHNKIEIENIMPKISIFNHVLFCWKKNDPFTKKNRTNKTSKVGQKSMAQLLTFFPFFFISFEPRHQLK
jgi:hypothetical protein